jgi:hypothetical protein
MRVSILTAIAAIVLGLTVTGSLPAAAQSEETTHTTKKVFGYQDARGAFHAVPRAALDPDAGTPTHTYSGTLEVVVTITLVTKGSTGDIVVCEADFTASSVDNTTQAVISYEETALANAKLSKGTWGIGSPGPATATPSPNTSAPQATCKILIPYSWTLLEPKETIKNSLEGDLSLAIAAVNKTTGVQTPLRTNQQAIVSTTVPTTDNQTTKYTVSATL